MLHMFSQVHLSAAMENVLYDGWRVRGREGKNVQRLAMHRQLDDP